MGDASSETFAQLPYVEKLRGCAFFRRGVKILSKAKQASTLIMPISDSKHAQNHAEQSKSRWELPVRIVSFKVHIPVNM